MAEHTVADLVHSLVGIRGVKMVSFTYRSKGTGELARHVIEIGHVVTELYRMDLDLLEHIIKGIDKVSDPVKFEACSKIIASREKSIEVGVGNNPAYTHADTYIHPLGLPGIKVHKETGEMYITGLVVNKVVLEEGEYKVVNSKPVTLAKKDIEKGLPSGKFRMYTLNGIKSAKVNGNTLVLE